MNKLMINELLETLSYGEQVFRTLRGVEPVLDERGRPRLIAGRNSTIFRIDFQGSCYALKCYTSKAAFGEEICAYLQTHHSNIIIRPRILSEELWVGTHYSDVALYPWEAGRTFEWMLRKALHDHDTALLRSLENRFISLVESIYQQEWRHGDMKPDNILVRPDGSLLLVDCDSLYAPTLPPRAHLGTPLYIHPLRGDAYDSHIDDYAVALIVLSLEALQRDLSLYRGETMVALPSEGNTERIRELFDGNTPLLSLLDALLSDDYKIIELNHILECIMHT